MPVASSSRRRMGVRHQASSDIEEDHPAPEPSRDDNDEDGGEDTTRRNRPSAKEKKPSKKQLDRNEVASKKATASEGEDDDEGGNEDEEDEEDAIDIQNFQDQPLSRADLQKLRGLASDWENCAAAIRGTWGALEDVAVAIADSAEGEDAANGISQLDRILKDLIDTNAEMGAHGKSLDDIYQQVARGELISDAVQRYHSGAKNEFDAYSAKTTRQKYAKVEKYSTFRQAIYEAQYPDKAMPPITDLIPKESGDDSDDDDDLEIGGVTQTYTCPITLTPLVNPLTSRVCGHSFSADAIRATFRSSNVSIKCPASGCRQMFTLADCKPNKELAKKVQARQRRAERAAAADSDAEEVIE